ncbi:hypothetical protein G8O24_03055 [Bradyrhizobium sp. INPA01-394B]|uniref:Uncharacterized protein n=1 Tax=Bradyrhizobium campsiandrae TaxID=1729892 RepID=A0ABR7U7Z2_9BRAD|nr:hypothetical protein [Bradyrhizobium campsiandrae]MBC9876324.1 hypothetical protein [Bradyrhizobium campsiandrae]MBC9980153.1 hypothetical protein [Bradyrhizobium campsiandrae]
MLGNGAGLSRLVARSGFALLCLLIGAGGRTPAAQEAGLSSYARAAEYCRGDVARPIAVSQDKHVLCLDGVVPSDLNVSVAADLAAHGIAVVRSRGGDAERAVQLANLLRDRNAVVVVRDFCLYACASFILLASAEAYVPDDALVAWGVFRRYADDDCTGFIEGEDQLGPLLTSLRCSAPPGDERPVERRWNEFYRDRVSATAFTDPPESRFVRRELMNLYRSTGQYPVVLWTWNPRYHANAIKTRLVYQHYPDSQEEVDAIAKRLGLVRRVIYDP